MIVDDFFRGDTTLSILGTIAMHHHLPAVVCGFCQKYVVPMLRQTHVTLPLAESNSNLHRYMGYCPTKAGCFRPVRVGKHATKPYNTYDWRAKPYHVKEVPTRVDFVDCPSNMAMESPPLIDDFPSELNLHLVQGFTSKPCLVTR